MLFIPLYWILLVTASVITILQLSKRFRKSMFGGEAYLNFTLPVRTEIHILARILSAFVWGLVYTFVSLISLAFLAIHGWKQIFELISEQWENFADLCLNEFGHSPLVVCPLFIASTIIFALLVISFIYMISCVGHLAKKYRSLAQFAAIIASFIVYRSLTTAISILFGSGLFTVGIWIDGVAPKSDNLMLGMIANLCVNFVLSLACTGISYLILDKKLNLE